MGRSADRDGEGRRTGELWRGACARCCGVMGMCVMSGLTHCAASPLSLNKAVFTRIFWKKKSLLTGLSSSRSSLRLYRRRAWMALPALAAWMCVGIRYRKSCNGRRVSRERAHRHGQADANTLGHWRHPHVRVLTPALLENRWSPHHLDFAHFIVFFMIITFNIYIF